ncbi:MAG: magnesium transporter CorA family protein [Patescibacteria group bacterium]|nr:magnesium transporter CorA family protein [Patescibacteria group bacterium]
MGQIQKVDFSSFSWINLTDPSEQEITNLGEKYKFHPLDITDCLSPSYRSKLDAYPKYIFWVMLLPYYDDQTREILSTELDIFISKEYLITINHNHLGIFNDFFHLFQISPDLRERYPDKSPEKLLYEIMHKLIVSSFPMIDHLNEDCDKIEKAIFSGKEKGMVSEILIIRRNITDFRKIMQVHKNVLKKAIHNFKASPLFVMKKADIYFESLIDTAKEIWDNLENLKERIEALQQTNESQISFRLSDIMRTLTIISVITFPATLLAAIFGMNTIHAMPFIDNHFGFWYVIGIMAIMITTMLTIFKRKGWM